MTNINKIWALGAVLLGIMLFVGCSKSSPSPPPVTLSSIQISADETSGLPVGYSRKYRAIGNYSDNSQKDITDTATWASSTTNAAISGAGIVTALVVGSSDISASSDGKTSPPITLNVTNAMFDHMVIDRKGGNVALPFNRYEQLRLFAVFSDFSVIDVTEFASWTSSDPGVILVNNTLNSPAKGEVHAIASTGSSIITATDLADGNNTATTTINVSNAVLTEVLVTPAERVTFAKGLVQEYVAQGLFDDGVTRDIHKSRINWESANDNIAKFNAAAELTAENTGDTTINVVDQVTFKFKNSPVRVTDAELVTIVTVPKGGVPGQAIQLPLGRVVEYTAYSVFTDSSFREVTNTTTFTSSDTSIALPISSTKFQGKKLGKVTITALDRISGKQAEPVDLEITAAVLESMTMVPNTVQPLNPDEVQILSVRGTYSDGTSADLTETSDWSSNAPDVARVLNYEGAKGQVTAISSGAATITAKDVQADVETSVVVNVN